MLVALTASADPITRAKALQLAQEFMVPGYQMAITKEATTRRAAATTAPYYIISRGDNQGYVIIAGDDCLPEVLGYTDHGNFDPTNLPPALQEMLDGWQNMVETAQANGTNTALAAQRKATRRASNRVSIAPFVTSHWGQGAPYNNNCPTLTSNGSRALTGCVATAASQILYYWRKDLPATLQSTTPIYGYGDAPVTRSVPKGTPMKWDLMLDRYGSEPQEFKDAVAEFVFATGAATWLTYGSSTSGNIEKIPYTFSAYFGMNGGTVHYRDSYSQEGWTQLIYKELEERRPVMYTGVHPDQGGHAVFIHGYNASDDKFYFNFGWDGGNDGYYTTATTDGMNGFSGSQSALIGAYPKTKNLAVDIVSPLHTYTNADNNFTVKITNNSTLPFSGIYLFAETSATKPSDLTKAKSKNTELEIAVGESAEVVLTAKPTREQAYYITVTDDALNVLAKIQVTPEKAENDLHLNRLSLDASSDTETLDGETYQVIYHNQSTAHASIANRADIAYSGTFRMDFYVYDEEKQEWTPVRTTSKLAEIDGQTDGTVSFGIISSYFEVGKKYMAHLQDQTSAKDDVHIDDDAANTLRFIRKESDNAMEVVSFEDDCLTLKGYFDNTAFNTSSFANKKAYKTATIYDLTQCNAVGNVTQSINPNALIYVADDSQATGTNVVCAGQCAHLVLTPGYNFTPRANFTAAEAEIQIGTEPHIWYWLTVPFTVDVPDGIIARQITGHTTSSIPNSYFETVKTLEAGRTYLLMGSTSNTLTLKASNVTVMAQPTQNADAAIVGTFASTTTPEGAMLLDYSEQPYLQPTEAGSDVEGLRAYWYDVTTTKKLRAYLSTAAETAHIELAKSIEQAYDMLKYWGDLMAQEDRATFKTKIQEAEHEFTHRGEGETELTTTGLIKRYAAQLLADGEAFIREGKLVNGKEVDFTDHITNPSFETTRPNASGWTLGKKEGVTTTGSVLQANLNNTFRTVGIEGANVFRSYIAADKSSVTLSQTVTGLTPGHYRLSAMLGTDTDQTVTLFADEATTTVSGHSFGTYYLTEAVIEDITVMPDEDAETGSLTIGVKEGHWYKADDFRLTYIGTLTDEEQATGIGSVAAEKASRQGIFTLQGIEVKKALQPGLYIIDGKKTYVK